MSKAGDHQNSARCPASPHSDVRWASPTAGRAADSSRPPTLRVVATGQGALRYQWYHGRAGDTSAPIAGATQSSYTPPRDRVGVTSYRVSVSNAAGSADSVAAQIDSRYRSFFAIARR